MTILELITRFQGLWKIAIPHLAEPSPQDAARWCDYAPSIVERAILRTGRRFAKDKVPPAFDAEEAYRYVTGVARSMTEELATASVHPYRAAMKSNTV